MRVGAETVGMRDAVLSVRGRKADAHAASLPNRGHRFGDFEDQPRTIRQIAAVFVRPHIRDVDVLHAGGSLAVNLGKVRIEDHLAKYESAIATATRS